jgi:hypothetical protein
MTEPTKPVNPRRISHEPSCRALRFIYNVRLRAKSEDDDLSANNQALNVIRLIPAIGSIHIYSYYYDPCGEALTEIGEPGERRDYSALLKTSSSALTT